MHLRYRYRVISKRSSTPVGAEVYIVRDPAQGRRGMSVGCDEGNFSFPEESFFTVRLCEEDCTRS